MTVPEAGTYEIDPAHSVVEFVVRHLGLAKVRGRFIEFTGTVVIGDDIASSSAVATLKATTIDTRDPGRDAYLRGPDVLDAASHPTLEFRSSGLRHERGNWLLDGDLSIAGATRPITLVVEFEGGAKDPGGNMRVGFSATTKVDREDFGLTWNQALEAGGWLVGKEIKIALSIEGVKQG